MSTIQNQQSGTEDEKAPQSADTSVPTAQSSVKAKKSPTAFRTISEVADDLDVQQHVLRFWETKFSQVKPLKRGGGRRYYRPEDVELLKRIHHLLYTEGYTIKGVQKLLKGQGKQQILAGDAGIPAANEIQAEPAPTRPQQVQEKSVNREGLSDKQRVILEAMLGDLKELRDMLRGEE